MCWADKLGVLWAFVVVGFLLAMAGDKSAIVTWPVIHDLLIVIVPVWVFFRLVDWLTGGPARRRGYVKARVIR